MGTLLNKNHPFRASITHNDSPSVASVSSESVEVPLATEKKAKSKLPPLSTKTKIIMYSVVGGIVAYGWSEIYDSIYPETSAENPKQKASTESTYGSDAAEDWAYQPQHRDVHTSRQSVSWLSRTFCKGGKRARFCD